MKWVNDGVVAANTILLRPVLLWISSSAVPSCHVSVDTVHPSLLWSSSSSSSPICFIWVTSVYVLMYYWSRLFKCQNHGPSLAFQHLSVMSLPDVIISHMVCLNVWPHAFLHRQGTVVSYEHVKEILLHI